MLPTPDYRLTDRQKESVYDPAEDSFLLMDAIEKDLEVIKTLRPRIALEIGVGSGVISSFLAKSIPSISLLSLGTDVNADACDAATTTAKMNGVAVEVVRCDLVSALLPRLSESIDILLFNPPYVPTDQEEVDASDLSRCWAGGSRGITTLQRLLPLVPQLLSMGGLFYLVALRENGIDELLKHSQKLRGSIVLERKAGIEYLYILKCCIRKESVYDPAEDSSRLMDAIDNEKDVEMLPTPDYRLTDRQKKSVYDPAEDSFLLVDAIEKDLEVIKMLRSRIALEIGVGSGVISAFLAKSLPSFSLSPPSGTDVNADACDAATTTAKMNGVRVEVVRCDLVSALLPRLSESIDILLFNPPYVPTDQEEVDASDLSRCWAGGSRGITTLQRLLPLVPQLLSMGGLFYLVALRENGIEELLKHSEKLRGSIVLERRAGIEYLYILKFERIL